ncbi:MAG: serine/threonine protein kinase [Deltaproteobacteria bacterium]|nr:serine/threonine protein kinase [Deltaproteobacteria bacterium]MCW5805110.1 serine/threonine protein kinase [Deltaproteobacteria bacterium]
MTRGTSTPGSAGSGLGPAAQERIARHQHAGEVLRARSIIVVACLLWLVVGTALDLATHHAIGSGSLAFVLAVRFATTVFHIAAVAPLFRSPLPPPRVATALASSVFPVTSFALMLLATHMGGLTSPYVSAVFVVIMGEAIALPSHWRSGALLAVLSTTAYPAGLLAATQLDPALGAQLHDAHAMFVFGTFVAVLLAAAIVGVWGGHVMWSLRQSVFESRKLGRYRLIKRIGQGGMGEVWRAEDRALRRSVALKILSPEHGRKPSRVARFEREIQATASIVHPSVVRIHDWGVTDDGVWYYAMDLLEGFDLATLVRRCGPLPPALAVHLFVPAADGLAEAHRRGIVHRDLKPGNMFVIAPDQEPQRLELLDFGIARIGDGDDAELTHAGAVMGTPGFMAPEVLAGAPAGNASDVYGFAAALYFALTGKTPRDTKHAPVSAANPTIPAALDDALVLALDAEPSRRPTATELGEKLGAANLEWTGSFRADRNHALAATTSDTSEDPSIDPEEPPTHVDGAGRP